MILSPTHHAGSTRWFVVLASAVGVLFAVVAKLFAVGLPVFAVELPRSAAWRRPVRVLAWIEAGILLAYGGVLTAVGLLAQAGFIAVAADADHGALRWHAYLWDPWFLIWGLLVAGALLASRRERA